MAACNSVNTRLCGENVSQPIKRPYKAAGGEKFLVAVTIGLAYRASIVIGIAKSLFIMRPGEKAYRSIENSIEHVRIARNNTSHHAPTPRVLARERKPSVKCWREGRGGSIAVAYEAKIIMSAVSRKRSWPMLFDIVKYPMT